MNRLTAVSPLSWEHYGGFYMRDFGTLHRVGWRVNLNLGSQHFRSVVISVSLNCLLCFLAVLAARATRRNGVV
jgi:hypothetical protein